MGSIKGIVFSYIELAISGKLFGSFAGNPIYTTNNLLDIARGKVTGARQAQIEGYTEGIINGTKDISELATNIIPTPPLSGTTMQVSSTSANDTLLGTGSRSVIVEYIEPTTELLKQIEVNLNGTVAVTVSVPIAFVSDFYVKQSATLDTVSDGDITIYNAGTVFNIIKASGNKSLQLFRYIPKDKNLYLSSMTVSGNSKAVSVRLRANISDNGTTTQCYIFRSVEVTADGANEVTFEPPMVINGGHYIKASIFSSATDNGGLVSVGINGWLENV